MGLSAFWSVHGEGKDPEQPHHTEQEEQVRGLPLPMSTLSTKLRESGERGAGEPTGKQVHAMENTETDPYKSSQLIFEQGNKKSSSQQMMLEQRDIQVQKNKKPRHRIKSVTKLNHYVKWKPVSFLDDNIGENLDDLGNSILGYDPIK